MKSLRRRITAGILAAAICITSAGTTFAAEGEKEKKGFWSSVGGWFVDRGADISNAASTAVDVTGRWFIDRGEDIREVSTVVGNWTSDRANDVIILVTSTGEAIVCAVSNFDPKVLADKEYYLESVEKLLLGEYSDVDPTALSIGLNLVASVVNADLGMDIRDLIYDIQYSGSGEVKLSGIALDAVALLPVIGALKNLKHLDTVADAADFVHDTAKAVDIADVATDTIKSADAIDEAVDTAKAIDHGADAAKAADVVDDAADAVKEIEKMGFDELYEEAQETFKLYEDCAWDGEKALENLKDGTRAGSVWGNVDGDLPLVDAADNPLSYREYDAFSLGDDPLPGLKPGGRGPCRFVRDNLGNTYFTDDHYDTFKLIVEAVAG